MAAYPLEHQSAEVIRTSTEQARVDAQATNGLKGRDIEIHAVTLDPADGLHVTLTLIGNPPLPPVVATAGDVACVVGHRVTPKLLMTLRSQFEVRSTASPDGSW